MLGPTPQQKPKTWHSRLLWLDCGLSCSGPRKEPNRANKPGRLAASARSLVVASAGPHQLVRSQPGCDQVWMAQATVCEWKAQTTVWLPRLCGYGPGFECKGGELLSSKPPSRNYLKWLESPLGKDMCAAKLMELWQSMANPLGLQQARERGGFKIQPGRWAKSDSTVARFP